MKRTSPPAGVYASPVAIHQARQQDLVEAHDELVVKGRPEAPLLQIRVDVDQAIGREVFRPPRDLGREFAVRIDNDDRPALGFDEGLVDEELHKLGFAAARRANDVAVPAPRSLRQESGYGVRDEPVKVGGRQSL